MTGKNVVQVDEGNFESAALKSSLPTLVDFTAAWCPPCRAIAPSVDAVGERYAGRLRVAACDVDKSPQLAAAYEIRSLPTLLLFKDGRVVGQIVGAVPRAKIEALVEKALG